MAHPSNIEGTCASRDLCKRIKFLTEQRLAFDTRMGERARAFDARPLSPTPNRHVSHGKAVEATHGASEPSHDLRSTQQSPGLLMSKEARVTYMKLRGDQLVHLAEMARHDSGFSTPQCEGLAAEALEAYMAAQQEANSKLDGSSMATNTVNSSSRSSSNDGSGTSGGDSGSLPEVHPLQLELVLRVSSVLLHLLDRPIEAWAVGYPTYLAAAEHPTRLGARGLTITQALRDHLACIDIQQGGRGQQGEDGGDSKQTATRNDIPSATAYGPGTARGTGEDGHEERLVEGEWGFLRMSAECDEATGQVVGYGTTASDKLRTLSQVKQARVCTATDRVLLGTMQQADAIQSALKQIFLAYTKKYAKSAQDWLEDSKNLPVHGRKAMPQSHLHQEPFLSWAAFEAVCQDFHIITTPIPSGAGPASSNPHPPANHHYVQQPVRGTPLDHHQQPKASLGASASKTIRQPDSPARIIPGEKPSSDGLLSGAQISIAFVSACTHRSVVASFPTGGKSDGVVSGEAARRDRLPRGGSTEKKGRTGAEDDAAHWRGIERAVLSGPAVLEAISAPGLNFRQFVDALARCGLLGFCGKRMLGGGLGGMIGGTLNTSDTLSPAERVQAIFISQMRLLDSLHVDATLQKLVRLPSANHDDGEGPEEGKSESTKQRNARGHAARSGHAGKKKGGHTQRGTNAGVPRGDRRGC